MAVLDAIGSPLDSQPTPLPPSGRDFIVYERVILDSATTRQAAAEAGISQTRVRQIVRRVIQWLAQTLPADSSQSEAAQLRVARHMAADRLEACYQSANRAWLSTGQPKYANLVIRIINAQSKLPVVAGAYEALMADVLAGPLPESGAGLSPAVPSHSENDPPVEDCSPAASQTAESEPDAADPHAQDTTEPTTCDAESAEARAARAAFFAPAHSAGDLPDNSLGSRPLTAGRLGFPSRRLSRKERRRRQRALTAKSSSVKST
jgi:hypothetical protein